MANSAVGSCPSELIERESVDCFSQPMHNASIVYVSIARFYYGRISASFGLRCSPLRKASIWIGGERETERLRGKQEENKRRGSENVRLVGFWTPGGCVAEQTINLSRIKQIEPGASDHSPF